jgi:hypothetical protein
VKEVFTKRIILLFILENVRTRSFWYDRLYFADYEGNFHNYYQFNKPEDRLDLVKECVKDIKNGTKEPFLILVSRACKVKMRLLISWIAISIYNVYNCNTN